MSPEQWLFDLPEEREFDAARLAHRDALIRYHARWDRGPDETDNITVSAEEIADFEQVALARERVLTALKAFENAIEENLA